MFITWVGSSSLCWSVFVNRGFLEVISGSGGNLENLHAIGFSCRSLCYTILSNNVHPKMIVKISNSTWNHLGKTSIERCNKDPVRNLSWKGACVGHDSNDRFCFEYFGSRVCTRGSINMTAHKWMLTMWIPRTFGTETETVSSDKIHHECPLLRRLGTADCHKAKR